MAGYRMNATMAGLFFLIAMVSSLVGGGMLDSVITGPQYLESLGAEANTVSTGVSLEFINAIAVLGIVAFLYPVLKRTDESLAIGYLSLRIFESLFCIVAAIVPLLLITVSQGYVVAGGMEISTYQPLGDLLLTVRTQMTGLMIPVFFGLSALILYSLLYRTNLVPRFISIWGLIAVIMILLVNVIEGGMAIKMILALPIILNEIFLGIWLIAKGFTPSAIEDTA